jgi:uncharacterized repeat protein (TIGR04138 family)
MPEAEQDNIEQQPLDLEDAVRGRILAHDKRYTIYAYEFIFEALHYTQQALGRRIESAEEKERHVSGQELLEGIRDLAHQRFGPLAPTVFRSWGVQSTEDFGEIVFNLVESSLLKKTSDDSRADFAGGFSFDEAFGGPIELK